MQKKYSTKITWLNHTESNFIWIKKHKKKQKKNQLCETNCIAYMHIVSHFMCQSENYCSLNLPRLSLAKILRCSQIPRCSVNSVFPWFSGRSRNLFGKSAALSVMSDNKKINHLLERASPLCLSLEEVELLWSKKRTLESAGGFCGLVLSI